MQDFSRMIAITEMSCDVCKDIKSLYLTLNKIFSTSGSYIETLMIF